MNEERLRALLNEIAAQDEAERTAEEERRAAAEAKSALASETQAAFPTKRGMAESALTSVNKIALEHGLSFDFLSEASPDADYFGTYRFRLTSNPARISNLPFLQASFDKDGVTLVISDANGSLLPEKRPLLRRTCRRRCSKNG
ncbi:hypothetical protein AAG607_12160 [Citromicrobium bathyomarinum]|uniref:hypothetical protein n=1 Tax=Citromicrobium bathyomarinum TaxID=72174 RepID=UPI00315AF5D3